jgi:hypothetical protein
VARFPTDKRAPAEAVFADFPVPAAVRHRAASALQRLLDKAVQEAVTARERASGSGGAHYQRESLGGGLDRADEEGQRLKREILAQPDMLPPEAAASHAGISRQGLDLRRTAGRALALSFAKRGFRYPAWQFDEKIAEPLAKVLEALSLRDPWRRYFFLTQPEPLLDGRTPLEALRTGDVTRVLEVAAILRDDEAP